jgi:hypothetical protein
VADDVGLIPSLVGAERLDEMLVAALSLLEAGALEALAVNKQGPLLHPTLEISPVAVSPNAISN